MKEKKIQENKQKLWNKKKGFRTYFYVSAYILQSLFWAQKKKYTIFKLCSLPLFDEDLDVQ